MIILVILHSNNKQYMYTVLRFVLLYFRDVGVGWGLGGWSVSCFHGHLNKCPLGDLNKCPLGNYLEGGGSEEIIKSTRFCKVHYVLNSDIKNHKPAKVTDTGGSKTYGSETLEKTE